MWKRMTFPMVPLFWTPRDDGPLTAIGNLRFHTPVNSVLHFYHIYASVYNSAGLEIKCSDFLLDVNLSFPLNLSLLCWDRGTV